MLKQQGGIYMFQLLDFYSCSGLALLWVTFFQTIAIGWFFGAQRYDVGIQGFSHR